jgi:tRNA pseudouridine38-40 synthase
LRYFFQIGYSGAQYRGWQRLPGIVSVQEVIEDALSAVLKQHLEIIGCGRTDALVHAAQYFFHVDIDQTWDFDLKYRLNKRLPADIAIFEIIPMEGLPHARFDAICRSYDFFIHGNKDPFMQPVSSHYVIDGMDLNKMRLAVDLLTHYNDFYAFCKKPMKNAHTICNVTTAKLYTNADGDRLRLHITSNRFLGGMIRIIVAKLIEIGKGTLSVAEFEGYLRDKITPPSIRSALPQGLFLTKVTYPYLDLPTRTQFAPFREPFGYWIEL